MSESQPGRLVGHQHVDAISSYLVAHGVQHEVVEHAEAFTAASEGRAAHVAADHVAKTVVLEDRGAYLLALLPASERLDLHKLRDGLGIGSSLRLATEDEMASHFSQFEIGAVPPVGEVMVAGEIVDQRLTGLDRVLCSGGDHRHSLMLDPADVVRLSDASVMDICLD